MKKGLKCVLCGVAAAVFAIAVNYFFPGQAPSATLGAGMILGASLMAGNSLTQKCLGFAASSLTYVIISVIVGGVILVFG